MSVTVAIISSGDPYPRMRAIEGLTVMKRPSGVDWKRPSTVFSKMER
jgi:hypothetical protein